MCSRKVFIKKRKPIGNNLGAVEEKFDDENDTNNQFSSLDKLRITHWTIRTICIQKIINSYSLLLNFWEEFLLGKLDAETSRIKGCKSQMESFNFFYSLPWSKALWSEW